jgi:hypothetical protein
MPITKATTNVVNLNQDTLINGLTAGKGKINNGTSTAFGVSALQNTVSGSNSTAIGFNVLANHTSGSGNTGIGSSALNDFTNGLTNTAVGSNAMRYVTTSNFSIAIGGSALDRPENSSRTIAIGNTASAGLGENPLIASNDNVCIGHASMSDAEGTVEQNTFIGSNSGRINKGNNNTGIGYGALRASLSTNNYNTSIGSFSADNSYGSYNSAIGSYTFPNCTGDSNTALGYGALRYPTTSVNNTAIGSLSLQTLPANTVNSTAIGYNSQVTGSNQVQLGNSVTTTYAYGAVQDRSDIRDKADVRDTELGLEFVNALRPVDFKWDIREDYRPESPKPVDKPVDLEEDATEEEKAKYAQKLADYNAYLVAENKWLEDIKLENITHDGSKKRNRYHHGLIAQEVKEVLDAKGIDFGGFQDHSVKGGDDVLSIGYNELIAPMIKAIQELSAEVASLKAQLNP